MSRPLDFRLWLRAIVDIQRFTSCLGVFWYLKKKKVDLHTVVLEDEEEDETSS